MQSTAEVMWQGREQPLVFLDSLKEAHLFYLEGMKNGPSPRVNWLIMFHSFLNTLWYPTKLHSEFGGSGCQAEISKGVYNVERGSS